ncbi:MAG TPA: hypothetical protein PLL54_00125 [Dermatophilaceae bacterium]|jgi:hypothetical protein|nr:hypothetical protein [Dermatophilaceae bacterium]
MTQATTSVRAVSPRHTSRSAPRRPTLRVVPAAIERTRNGVFAGACMAVLVLGLLTLLLLNTQLAQGAFVLKDLTRQQIALTDQKLELSRAIDAQRSPANVAAKAKALGMVPAASMAFIDLDTGRIIGEARPAVAPGAPAAPVSGPAPGAAAPAAPGAAAPALPAPAPAVGLPAGDAPDAPGGAPVPATPAAG